MTASDRKRVPQRVLGGRAETVDFEARHLSGHGPDHQALWALALLVDSAGRGRRVPALAEPAPQVVL